jgi:CheY-like chemotaxis protein
MFKKKHDNKSKTDEIAALRAELAEVRAQAENANRVKSAFFTSVSHEIRTPMNAVVGISELMLEDTTAETRQSQVEIIKTHSNILLGIIDDLLDFSGIEDGTFKLQPIHYHFPAMLDEVISIARLAAREKGLEFITEIPAALPLCLFGDASKLSRALVNLLSNAVKFTERGSVTLSLEVYENKLNFSVRDTGIGIKPVEFERLFKVFGKAERASIGLGLGLTITDNIVRVMNGKLTAESIYEFGSVFRVEIPFEAGDEKQSELNNDGVFVFAPEAKVLIVDDIDVNLTVGIGFLKLHGISPDAATSGKEAIKRVCEKDYDLVLMDYMMPETDGGKASEIIRSFGGKYAKGDNGLKIIALTASVTPEAKELMLKSGMDDFLPKPLTKQAVNRILIKWLPPHKCEIVERDTNSYGGEFKAEDFPLFIKAEKKVIGLNIKLGFTRAGGTAEAFESSLKLLYRRIPKSLEKLEKSLEEKKLRDFEVEAHGMKGAFAINGLEKLSGLAYELELLAESENALTISKKLPPFREKLLTLEASLKEIFEEEAKPEIPRKRGSYAILERFVEDLFIDIERFDREHAFEEIRDAQEYYFDKKTDKLFELLKIDLEDFDYDSAMEKLQDFNVGADADFNLN